MWFVLLSLIVLPVSFAALGVPDLDSKSCDNFNAKNDPDRFTPKPSSEKKTDQEEEVEKPDKKPSSDYSYYPNFVTGITEVVYHNSYTTNRQANFGTISYGASSLSGDEEFYQAAYYFYRDLKKIDRTQGTSPSSLVPIDKKSPDLYSIALAYANNKPYLALKILNLYGHDNMLNELKGDTCQSRLLDSVKPDSNSYLYQNGSLGSIQYDQEKIDQGMQIALDCNNEEFTEDERNMCNDNHIAYQADYYHVIASSFLFCRQLKATRANAASKIAFVIGKKYSDAEYISQVKTYKLARFREEIRMSEQENVDYKIKPEIRSLILKGWERIAYGKKPILDPREQMPKEITDRDYKVAQAILNRYAFEVEFRVYQHKLGMEFGRKACENEGPLPKDLGPTDCAEEKK